MYPAKECPVIRLLLKTDQDVWVYLTQRGLDHLLAFQEQVKSHPVDGPLVEGILKSRIEYTMYKFPFVQFMRIMGPLFHDGGRSPIKHDAILTEEP